MTLGLFPFLCIFLRKVIMYWLAKKRGLSGLCRVGPQPGLAQPWIPAALSGNRCEQPRLQHPEPGVMLQGCRCRDQAVPAAFAGLIRGSAAACTALGCRPSEATRRFCARSRVLQKERGNKCTQEQSQRSPGRPRSRVTGSAHPNSLWKELPRHRETSSCV